jgi:DNA polymerase-3 subunit gamma/tau
MLDYDYYFRVVESAQKEDIPSSLLLLNDVIEKGFDSHNFIIGLADHFRNLLVCKDMRTAALLEVGETVEQRFIDQSKQIDTPVILRSLAILSKADVEYKSSKNQRLLVELALMQLCSLRQEQEKKNG